MADYKSDYLNSVLESYRMKHIEELINTYRTKRNEIKLFLNEQYGRHIYEPFNSGSYKKHTAINTKFDLDLVVPFKRNAFSTLEDMFEDVFEKLTLIDWLSKNFLLSKLISRTVFALSIFILLLIIVYLQIITNGSILEIKNLITSFFFIVLVLLSSLAIKEVLNFKEDNKKSFINIQKKLLESTNCDKNDLKNELFEAILLESKKLNDNNALINFGEYRIDLLHHYLYNETIVQSIHLLNSPFYNFQKFCTSMKLQNLKLLDSA